MGQVVSSPGQARCPVPRARPRTAASGRRCGPAAGAPGSRSSGHGRGRRSRSRAGCRRPRTRRPRAERERLAVELGLDLAREEDVRLLERVVVRLGGAADLVVDREHRHVVGAERLVDHHLHGDPAVGEDRDVHAGGLPAARRVLDRERLGLGRRALPVADEPAGRVGLAERYGGGGQRLHVGPARARRSCPGTGASGGRRGRRGHRQPADRPGRRRRQRVVRPDRDQGEVAGDEPVDATVDLEDQLALEDVQRLLERVDVAAEPAARRQRTRRELRVRRALGRPDEDARATAPTTSASR